MELDPVNGATDQARIRRRTRAAEIKEAHDEQVRAKVDADWAVTVAKYTVSPEKLRREQAVQDARSRQLERSKYVDMIRSSRNAMAKAQRRQAKDEVKVFRKRVAERTAAHVSLQKEVQRNFSRLERRAKEEATFKAMVERGVMPSAGGSIFDESTIENPADPLEKERKMEARKERFAGYAAGMGDGTGDAYNAADAISDDGDYESDDEEMERRRQRDRLRAAPDLLSSRTEASVEAFADTFLSPKEMDQLRALPPPARRSTGMNTTASLEAVREGSIEWASGLAGADVQRLYSVSTAHLSPDFAAARKEAKKANRRRRASALHVAGK